MKQKTKIIIALILIPLVIGIIGFSLGYVMGENKVIETSTNCLDKCYSLTCFKTCFFYELTNHRIVKIK